MFDFKTEEGLVKWGNVAKIHYCYFWFLILMIGSGGNVGK
jgi:hypothetical protein